MFRVENTSSWIWPPIALLVGAALSFLWIRLYAGGEAGQTVSDTAMRNLLMREPLDGDKPYLKNLLVLPPIVAPHPGSPEMSESAIDAEMQKLATGDSRTRKAAASQLIHQGEAVLDKINNLISITSDPRIKSEAEVLRHQVLDSLASRTVWRVYADQLIMVNKENPAKVVVSGSADWFRTLRNERDKHDLAYRRSIISTERRLIEKDQMRARITNIKQEGSQLVFTLNRGESDGLKVGSLLEPSWREEWRVPDPNPERAQRGITVRRANGARAGSAGFIEITEVRADTSTAVAKSDRARVIRLSATKPGRSFVGAFARVVPDPGVDFRDYLNKLRKDNPNLTYSYAWWREPMWVMTLWGGGSFLVIGVLWPIAINLISYRSFLKPRDVKEPRRKLKPARKVKTKDEPVPVLSAGEAEQMDNMEGEMEEFLKNYGNEDAKEEQSEKPVVQLKQGAEAEEVEQKQPEEEEDVSYRGEYYPVIQRTEKKDK